MWPVLGILFITTLIIVMEVPPLWKKVKKKELIVFFSLLLFGSGLSIAYCLGVDIPNPLDLITFIYQPISDAVTKLIE